MVLFLPESFGAAREIARAARLFLLRAEQIAVSERRQACRPGAGPMRAMWAIAQRH
jgi:hypothetical protein